MQPTAKPVTLYFKPSLWFGFGLFAFLNISFILSIFFQDLLLSTLWWIGIAIYFLVLILGYPVIKADERKIAFTRLYKMNTWQLDWQDIFEIRVIPRKSTIHSSADTHFDIVFLTDTTSKTFSTANYINKQAFFAYEPIAKRSNLTAYQEFSIKQEYGWELLIGLLIILICINGSLFGYYDDLDTAFHIKAFDDSWITGLFWAEKSYLWLIVYAFLLLVPKTAKYVSLKIRPEYQYTVWLFIFLLFTVVLVMPKWLRYQNEQSPISQPVYECSFDFSDGFYYQTWQCQNPQNQHIVKFSVHDDDKIYNKALKRNQVYLLKISEGKLNDFFIQPQDFQKIETR